jgi:RNase P subunit RPR2
MNNKPPVVTDIQIDPKRLEKARAKFSRFRAGYSKKWKMNLLRSYGISLCHNCNEVATKLVSYDVSDEEIRCSKVEHYCLSCYDRLVLLSNGRDQIMAEKVEKNFTNSA